MPLVAPTTVTPAAAATVTTPNPTLGCTLVAIGDGTTQKAEWQLATDSGFTANVKTVTETNADLRVSGATTESPTILNLNLSNGTWFIRARAIQNGGAQGPYSTGQSFTVNTPVLPTPTAVTPANAASVTTMTPVLGGTLGVDGAGRTQKMEWQIDSANTFATGNLRSVIEPDSDLRASGATTETLPANIKLTSNVATTWYLRGRSVGIDGTTSAWAATTSFTLAMAAPPTPTAVTPSNGATVTSSQPTLGATLGAATESRTVKAQWQLATDSGFTANVRTITESDTDLRASGATTEAIPIGSKLYQTLWYMRCREVDQYGQAGSYSANQSFTVAHPPVAAPTSPINDSNVIYSATPTFSWNFSDPYSGDAQTARQVIVERNDTGAVVIDSGKSAGSSTSIALAIGTGFKDIKLRWKVRVWDQDDVPGNYSPYQLFTLSDVPTVTITSPTNAQVIATGQPTVTWTVDAGTTQVARRLEFRKQSDSSLVHDTGIVNTSSLTYTAPVTILQNSTAYSVTVTVYDTMGLSGSAVRNFSVSYSPPVVSTFTVDPSPYDDLGYVLIDWSATTADGFFVQWNVYRRLVGAVDWEQIYTTTNVSTRTYQDWLAGAGLEYEYAVTQIATRSGTPYEAALVASSPALANGTHYWFINPNSPSDNLRVPHVTGDSFSDPYESESLTIIGRGRKRNQGTRIGYTGALDCELRTDAISTARAKRLQLELLKEDAEVLYMRTPFGDVFQVALGNLSFSRVAGVGTNEFVDANVPYEEVF